MIIVHVITRLLNGGAEENTLESCGSQIAKGHRVILVHGASVDANFRTKTEKIVSEVIQVSSMVHDISPIDDLRATFILTGLFKRLKPDVVHTHQSKAGIVGRIAAYWARVPMIIHGIHILPFVNVGRMEELLFVTAERFCARFTDSFISVSPSVRDAFIEKRIASRDRHFVARSAMDLRRFTGAFPPRDWRDLLGVALYAEQPPTAVMLASFEARKRHADLIIALPSAFSGLPDWRLVFAGSGETETQAQALVAKLGLSDRVRFAGFRSDPEAIIALADVCMLTSKREGLPRVLIQYIAAGKPTVVSRLPGIEDIVQDGVSAVIASGDDVASAARAVARLLCDSVEREKLAAGARSICLDDWSPERVSEAVTLAYSSKAMTRSFRWKANETARADG
jgi:glycosyltransferase involved in cell wall biosynthesis